MNYWEARRLLRQYGQEHVLRYYSGLNRKERAALLAQIGKTDFSVLALTDPAVRAEAFKRGAFEPLSAMTVEEIRAREAEFREIGLRALREEKVAAVLLAGGQGTRLGSDHPKGVYNIGKTRDLYIFECLVRNMLDVVRESGHFMPLYVMTSVINHDETVSFFEAHRYFGYDPSYVRFFIQDMAPCVSFDGKILMESRSKIAESPNGNGGWFRSMIRAGLEDDMRARGVEYVSAFAVDNVCQRINDPVFVGAVIASGMDCGGKVVRKADPNERVGVLCLEDGQPSIVEYYEMTEDMIHLKDGHGQLLYAFGVILNYLFRLSVLHDIADGKMMTHVVEKKIPCLDPDGQPVKPEKPNGYKFELLILDMIHMTRSCLPYEVVREKEFAPIKNPTGVDSVVSAQALLEKNGVVL
ncbi:MAG: UDPGP type 1 family protein [Lachnospiraceae bacterium]|nr:UDPGP type 1 family protein [Lachnospiraceae bacterium]MBP5255157.1 UDPGP type 1 family protein [Lachnospiraceae bacterium]